MNKSWMTISLMMLMLCSIAHPLFLVSNSLDTTMTANVSARSSACTGDVCLNEIIPDPNGADTGVYPGGEWFELYNNGNADVDLTGWYATTSASKTLAFDANTIVGYQSSNASTYTISPQEYVVIARNGNANFYLTNTGMSMTLYDSSNNPLHTATWGQTSSGVSYEQDAASATANWVPTGSPTPGQANNGATPSTLVPGDLVISEVMANPWPSNDNATWPGGEWVEVYNSGNADIDLTGYSLTDAAGNALAFDTSHLVNASAQSSSFLIGAGQFRIVAVNGSSSSGVLNNGVETLTLRWPNGTPTQEIGWSSTIQGFSLVDASQTNGLWTYASYPTPEGPNPATISMMPRQSQAIVLTEILPNATDDGASYPDGEWVELHNTGTTSVDLMGWSLIDGMGNITYLDPGSLVFNTTQGATSIEPDGRRLVQFIGDNQLWDNYNHVFLRNESKIVVDAAVYYTDYGENISLIRGSQPTDPWTPSPWMTPGQPEPGSTPSASTVRFSEIMPDAIGADNQQWPNGEWIELFNFGDADVDLTGWKLQAASRSLTLHEFSMPLQSTPIIPAGGVVLIALNGTSSFYLKHTSADSIGLLNQFGATVDSISWSSTVEGESLIPPNSTHAGVGPNGSQASGDWKQSAWPTPGIVNPSWPAYNGSTQLRITEVLPYCQDDSINPVEDWIEILNTGNVPINISRWSVLTAQGDRRFIRLDKLWAEENMTAQVVLAPNQRAVFTMNEWILTGLGDSFSLLHPDGDAVDSSSWTVITDCQTLMPSDDVGSDWQHTLWPTPGSPEPNPSDFATYSDIKFTRFMPSASSSLSKEMEFIELQNLGNNIAVLNGWILRSTSSSFSTYNVTINSLVIQAGDSVILANDAPSLERYETGRIVDLTSILDRTFYFPNSGAALQLFDPSGSVADTLVYGNGPTAISGWSGIALVEPISGLANVVYLRGSGCGQSADTDTVEDWHLRWSRLGGSTFCYENELSSQGTLTPLISPENGAAELIDWIDQAESSLHVHLYQLHQAQLVNALIDAQNRGVEVIVVLDAGDDWWTPYELDMQLGMATELLAAGVAVLWFGDEGEEPYAYIHSKVAVRDGNSVWMGSGNWKPSSHPAQGDAGNRDWGIIIDDPAFAVMVLEHLAFDEDTSKLHIKTAVSSDRPSGWSMPNSSPIAPSAATSIEGDYEAQLLVCPDTCIGQLAQYLDSAQEEILLSLQYFDMDWTYGWGDNPIVASLEQAAVRGVRIEIIINGAYLDEDIQSMVDTINEDWNFSKGYDVAAIIMSSDMSSVTKLHNKGAIIDGELTLISSINWGDSALIRNREMGVILTNKEVAAVYKQSWRADWERLDDITDSDQDALLDAWEVMYGLHRTRRSVEGDALRDESMLDIDEDGLTNLAEQMHGSNPLLADTDGDCILDGLEVAWAQATLLDTSIADVTPFAALHLADADGDGTNESEVLGCDLGGIELPQENNSNSVNDEDADGILDADDMCPQTLAGSATDEFGCSSAQRLALVEQSTDQSSGQTKSFFFVLMLLAILLTLGSFFFLSKMKQSADQEKNGMNEDDFQLITSQVNTTTWHKPILDATSQPQVTAEMLQRVPGWTQEMVLEYFELGWTMDQLAQYYEQQMAEHASVE